MAQLAALEAAMGEMEAARATFEVKAQAVSDELEKLQQQVERTAAHKKSIGGRKVFCEVSMQDWPKELLTAVTCQNAP
eukprot:COSAG04_NODE_358_length_16025_cov_193.915610_9_plen_78_part_00